MDKRIGFIGAGQMAEALARGFIAKGVCRAEHVFATDPVQDRKEVFRSFSTNPVDGNIEVGVLPARPLRACSAGTPAGTLPRGIMPGPAVPLTSAALSAAPSPRAGGPVR